MSVARLNIGIYVDEANISRNGGYGMRYEVLREFACHDSAEAIRLNTYIPYDEERAKVDYCYHRKVNNFYSVLRDLGYKVIQKTVKKFTDDDGNVFSRGNADLDMAVDIILQSEKLDRVLLVTGDGDFVQVVRALQNKGCRVELVAFNNVSRELRREVDVFVSGYLIPNLLPVEGSPSPWGEIGSRVRGYCYDFKRDRGFGFMRFLRRYDKNLWITDYRCADSPFETVFFHVSSIRGEFDASLLPSRNVFFEFDLHESTREEGFEANDISVVAQL
ncbi:MAG: NYN domain-containing protein [Opitutales bacterium]